MNEQEFIKKYEEEKPLFRSWGNKIAETINQKLFDRGINPSEFLKIPINVRIKDNTSIIAKAFLRKEKNTQIRIRKSLIKLEYGLLY